MLMVGGNAGLIGMSKVSIDYCYRSSTRHPFQEHLGVALALNVPIAVCVTKVSIPLYWPVLHAYSNPTD